jgi:hypothetical protein
MSRLSCWLPEQLLVPSEEGVVCTPTPPNSLSSSGPSHRRNPPIGMSVVVVRETPPSALSPRTEPIPSRSAFTGRIMEPTSNSPSLLAGAFRLQPRGKPTATPSPMTASRGRKRSAQCLASTSMGAVTRSLFSSSESSSVPSWASPAGTSHSSYPESPPSSTYSPIPMPSEAMSMDMQSLSIKSPNISRVLGDCPSPSKHTKVAARTGSSFLLYSSSPMGSSPMRPSFARPRAESTGSGCSLSVKSSPKLALLTVLQRNGEEMNKTPTQRPPLHGGLSSMLYSLDSKRGDESDDDEEMPRTPIQPPAVVDYVPPFSNGSSISTMRDQESPTKTRSSPQRISQPRPLQQAKVASPSARGTSQRSPATPPRRRTHRSPFGTPSSRRSHRSPYGTPDSRRSHLSPHDTPLPRIRLTPRSDASRGILPRLPSPSARDLGLMPIDLVIERSSQSPSFLAESAAMAVATHHSFSMYSTNSPVTASNDLKQRATTSESAPGFNMYPSLPRSPRKASYLPIPDWSDDRSPERPVNHQRFALPSCGIQIFPRSCQGTPPHANNNVSSSHMGMEESPVPGVQTKSLLTPSKSGSILESMMEADERAAAMYVEDSLTDDDDDDDEAFVLTDPAILVEESQTLGRSRQRQRRSYTTSLDYQSGNVRQSSMSLDDSAHASSASLLGMGFLLADSTASLLQREPTPISSSLPTTTHIKLDGPNGASQQGGELSCLRSEGSFGSIGLALEPSNKEGTGRDLITPPPMANATMCSPPFSNDGVDHHQHVNNKITTTPVRTVYISRSDPDAVSMTIARMVFQVQNHSPLHNHSPPEMKCPG